MGIISVISDALMCENYRNGNGPYLLDLICNDYVVNALVTALVIATKADENHVCTSLNLYCVDKMRICVKFQLNLSYKKQEQTLHTEFNHNKTMTLEIL